MTGVGCVGKTAVGKKLAALLGIPFFDLDAEIESYFGTSIARLQNRFLTPHSYRKEASNALKHVLSRDDSRNCVVALPPSGLMDSYWRLLKNSGATIVVLVDSPENILNRIVFYDLDSKLIDRRLSEKEKGLCLKEIKGDIAYFGRTYRRANMTVDIAGLAVCRTQADLGQTVKCSESLFMHNRKELPIMWHIMNTYFNFHLSPTGC